MSRCFPFPPPGYERKNKEALIESIKREQDKAEKKRRKEEKREKKERKKNEKKEKSGISGEVEKKRHSHKDEKANADHKFLDYKSKKVCEAEQLEKSGLSEEHGQPSSVPKLCDSSDSTQNSHKRKKHSSPLEGNNHNQSTMLRIRLPLVKHKDPEELRSKQQLCSSSGGTETPGHNMADVGGPSSSKKQSCSVSGRTEIPAQHRSGPAAAIVAPVELSPKESGSLSDAQLRYLLDNWAPPQIQTELTDFDDQEWLFDMPSRCEPKRCKVSNVASCNESSSLWPRARYLPEAEIYALPYTVPF